MSRLASHLTPLLALIGALGCVEFFVEANDEGEDSGSETDTGDGDGDPSGDGDGDSTTSGDGDGDGDPTSGDGDGESEPPPSFRVAVIAAPSVPSDTYEGTEPNIDVARDRLLEARDKIAAIDPAPDFVVVIGDLVHEAYDSEEADWYQTNPNAFSDVEAILDGFPMPVYPLFGDGDYSVPKHTKQFSHQIFLNTFVVEPYYSIEHLGWRFVFTNSQLGQTFDEGTVLYDTAVGSYGDAQLNWIRDQLDAGLPTVLFTHFPLFEVQDNENEGGAYADIEDAIAGADLLGLILAGHSLTWSELPANYVAPHYGFGSTRNDSDNFLLFEFTTDAFQYAILDKDKVEWDGQGAETWVYEGDPAPGG